MLGGWPRARWRPVGLLGGILETGWLIRFLCGLIGARAIEFRRGVGSSRRGAADRLLLHDAGDPGGEPLDLVFPILEQVDPLPPSRTDRRTHRWAPRPRRAPQMVRAVLRSFEEWLMKTCAPTAAVLNGAGHNIVAVSPRMKEDGAEELRNCSAGRVRYVTWQCRGPPLHRRPDRLNRISTDENTDAFHTAWVTSRPADQVIWKCS
jgi:hypothetical protein